MSAACVAFAAASHAGNVSWHNVVSRTRVSDILVEGDAVWLSFLGGGAARYERRTGGVEFLTAAEGLVHNYVTAVAADEDAIYFASRNGLTTMPRRGGPLKPTIRTWGYAHNDCTDVAADENYIYVATLEGARRFDKATTAVTFAPLPPSEGPPAKLSAQVEDGWKVYVTPDGVVLDDLYSVTLAGDVVYWGGRGRLFSSAPGAEGWREVNVELPTMAVVRRVLRADDRLVVATSEGVFDFDGGATRRASGPLGRVDVRDALRFAGLEYYASAEGLFVRRGDGAPFSFAAGVGASWTKVKDARKKKSAVWRLGVADGFGTARATALGKWGETIIVGTEDGAYTLEPASGEVRPLPVPRGLPPGGVYALAYGDGELFAGTPNGLAVIDAGDFAVKKFRLPGRWNDVRDIAVYGDELLLTTAAGVATFARESWSLKKFELKAGGFDAEGMRALRLGSRYYLGTDAGVFELDGDLNLVRRFGEAEGFPAAPVRAMLAADGRLLCATLGGGLAIIDPTNNSVTVRKKDEGLSADVLFSLAADEGHIYVGTFDKGVDILDRALNFERNVSWGDGLSHTDIWAAARAGDWLWLAIRGVGLNAYGLDEKAPGEVRRYYARYGLGDEYCRAITVMPAEPGRTRLAFATAAGVAVVDFEGEPPDYGADDYDRNYP